MRNLILKILAYCAPLIIIALFFVVDDPFSIVHNDNGLAEKSSDIISTNNFLNTVDTCKYNVFLLGNSKINGFKKTEVESHLEKGEKSFFFNAPGECIFNYYKKIELIKKNNCKINKAIILFDDGIIINHKNESSIYQGPVYNHSPYTSSINWFNFYSKYINYYFTDFFFAKHIYYRVTGTYKTWMKSAFVEPKPLSTHLKSLLVKDSLLEYNFNEYKKIYRPVYNRKHNSNDFVTEIHESDLVYLKKIKQILDEDKTEYYIFIPPYFSKKSINKNIKKQLFEIFENRICDFSGDNFISQDSTYFYESAHFSYRAGKIMLDSIFKK